MTHNAIVDKNGDVYVFGNNHNGQLGLGDSKRMQPFPVKLESLKSIVSTAVGFNYTLYLDSDGFVWISGKIQSKTRKHSIPEKIQNVSGVVKIASGRSHCLLLTKNGIVLSFGNSQYGKLGLGNQCPAFQHTPKRILNIPRMKDICCSEMRSCFLDEKGNYWCAGLSATGFETVPKKFEFRQKFKSFGTFSRGTLLIGNNGNLYFSGHGSECYQIFGLPKMQAVYCCQDDVFMIDVNSDVWGFGSNIYGQLGLGDVGRVNTPIKLPFKDVSSIFCADYSAIIINSKGEWFGVGNNNAGQLGQGYSGHPIKSPAEIKIFNSEPF